MLTRRNYSEGGSAYLKGGHVGGRIVHHSFGQARVDHVYYVLDGDGSLEVWRGV
jgi:hypothetical protein